MSKKDYSLALKFTAKTSEVARKVRGLTRDINMRFSTSSSWAVRGIGKIVSGFGGVASAVTRIGGLIGGVFVGGLKMAFGLVGRIARGLMSLPMTGLKFLAAGAAGVFAAHKSLGPAAEMERYKTQLDVMKKSSLYGFLTRASAGKPFQMGETVQSGVLMEAFKIGSRKYLSTVMDAAAGFKKPLEEIVRMLGYARSGRTGEALESSARIGITRSDLKKFGIRFQKSGAATVATAGKLMDAMVGLMKSRFGGMANRIGTGTYEGAVSDLKDSLFRAFAHAGQKFLPFATKIVRDVSRSITSIGGKLKALPWDKWGASLASGVHKAGNIIDNLMDPKRRKDITKSITDGWNAVKGDIPKLGKALVLDLIDIASAAFATKMSTSFDSIFKDGGLLLGALITDPFILLWNNIYPSLLSFAKTIALTIADMVYAVQRSYTWSSAGKQKLNKEREDKKTQINANHKEMKKSWKGETTTSIVLTKWKKELALLGKNGGKMSNSLAVLAKMKKDSGLDKIVEKLTADRKIKPIALSLLHPGLDTGYINGKAAPLDKQQRASNAATQKLADLFPGLVSIKKEIDVFGREIFNSFSIDMKKSGQENVGLLRQLLTEMRKLNKSIGG